MTLTILKISIFRPVLIRSFSFFLDITNHFFSHSERKISTSPCLRPSAVRLQKAAKVRRKGTYAGASRSGISLTFGRIQIFRGNCGMGGLKLREPHFSTNSLGSRSNPFCSPTTRTGVSRFRAGLSSPVGDSRKVAGVV